MLLRELVLRVLRPLAHDVPMRSIAELGDELLIRETSADPSDPRLR